MAETEEYGAATRFHLWRRYNTSPFRRFALTVDRAETPDGYEIIDHDPKVADSEFLAKFARFMATPQQEVPDGYISDFACVTTVEDVTQPGQLAHYEAAIRRISWAARMPTGRQA